MKNYLVLFVFIFSGLSISSPNLKKLGEANLTIWGFKIYNAKLFGEKKKETFDQKLILKLTYQRDFSGESIYERSLDEFETNEVPKERIKKWKKLMKGMFPDVKEGDSIEAHYDPQSGVKMILNGKKEFAKSEDKIFAKDFMGIWLSPKTSEPELRRKLFGEK